jgi:hypothetical protein
VLQAVTSFSIQEAASSGGGEGGVHASDAAVSSIPSALSLLVDPNGNDFQFETMFVTARALL